MKTAFRILFVALAFTALNREACFAQKVAGVMTTDSLAVREAKAKDGPDVQAPPTQVKGPIKGHKKQARMAKKTAHTSEKTAGAKPLTNKEQGQQKAALKMQERSNSKENASKERDMSGFEPVKPE
jgi:hypothetical protein